MTETARSTRLARLAKSTISFEERSISIRGRVDRFMDAIDSLIKQSPKLLRNTDIVGLCKKERGKLEALYPNANTRHRYFTKYRNAMTGYYQEFCFYYKIKEVESDDLEVKRNKKGKSKAEKGRVSGISGSDKRIKSGSNGSINDIKRKTKIKVSDQEREKSNNKRDSGNEGNSNNALRSFKNSKKLPSKIALQLKNLELIKNAVLQEMKLDKNEAEERKYKINLSLDLKTNHIALFDLDVFLSTCREYLRKSQDPYTIAIGLMGLTGRRSIEILKTASFYTLSKNIMEFSGQAKTKNSQNARSTYSIPVLDDPKVILSALKRMRAKLDLSALDNEQIDKIHGRKLLERVKKLGHCIFTNEHISLNCRSLRSIYVTCAYHLFDMGTKVSFNAYASKILGHSHLDKDTANSYTYFAIQPKEPRQLL